MHAPLLRSVLLRDRQQLVAKQAELYAQDLSRAEVELHQLDRFNAVWAYCLAEIPFYQAWAAEHDLPSRLGSLSELHAFPLLTKTDIVNRADEVFENGKITAAYSTGGSSGEPARYPRGEKDADASYANIYAGRAWWGIRPFDSYLHLWGHSHLFGGSGLSGRVVKAKRKLADAMANAVRVNAYDMTTEALQSHHAALVRANPVYIVGYTSAVFKLARHIESTGADVTGLTKLKAVIVTAETVTKSDADLISRVLGAPVVIEYGAAETGVMALSRGDSWPLQVMWQNNILTIKDADIVVTTLTDRLFPLINYAIGDRAEGGDVVNGNALALGAVTGRAKDVVTVATTDGRELELSAILPVHLLKGEPGITAVQFRQEGPSNVRVFLSADRHLTLEGVAKVFNSHMLKDHPDYDPASVQFELVDSPVLTKAGKQALFV